MRVIWKDSEVKPHKPMKYRNYMIYGTSAGWTVDIEGDEDVFVAHDNLNGAINNDQVIVEITSKNPLSIVLNAPLPNGPTLSKKLQP